jgi:hypothetical protein
MDNRNRLTKIEDLARSTQALISAIHQQAAQPWTSLQDDKVLHESILALCQYVLDTTQAGSIHLLALRFIEDNKEPCPLLSERAAHIHEKPILEYELRTNSVFPMLYTLRKQPIPLLASLLDNSHVLFRTHFLMIENTAHNITEYMKYLKERRYFSTKTLTAALSRVLEHRHNSINIRDERTLFGPLRAIFHRVDYSIAFNTRFPSKICLPERCNQRFRYLQVPGIRVNFFNELEMKKSFFEKILRSNNFVENWNIWTNEEAREFLHQQRMGLQPDETPMDSSASASTEKDSAPAPPSDEVD